MPTLLDTLTQIKKVIQARLIAIFVLSLIVAGVEGFIIRSEQGKYSTYSKIFPLSINKSGGGSSPIDAIRAQFGISDKTDYEKIYNVKELVTSKTISRNVVQSKPIHSKYNSLSAWIIDDYNNNLPFWKKKLKVNLKDTNDIHIKAASLLLMNTKIASDPKTYFTTITTESHQEELTQQMNDKIMQELSSYYIKLVTEKPRTDLYKIKLMRDSLQKELYSTERAIAGFIDSNQMSVKSITQLPQYKLVRMQKEIEALYTTTATSYQNAKFKLLSESPIFQVLDSAGPPYQYDKPSWKKFAVIAFIISTFVLTLFFCRKIFWNLLLDELKKA